MEQILIKYYENNAKKLHKTVDKILLKFGGLLEKDVDDFYSLANEVFVDAMKRYDDSQSFDAFLYSCLLNRIKTEMTRRNREKRKADRMSISIDTPIGEEGEFTVGDMIADTFTIEKELFDKSEGGYSKRMLSYLSKLSILQKEVLKLNAAGYLANEIREELHISEKQYADCFSAIRSYRNTSVLL
ncbi:MAG: sigma-70 family RNA polymerase sigma factor [Lachnospiraceae bacterium]|nr:sigma-70 family RNA polymerase sigma factor [Lachnospiraceae bacterium]